MCGLAEILLQEGLDVSGCDLEHSERTAHLEQLGARLNVGHGPEHLEAVDVVVVSSAISHDNPEVVAARNRNIPVVRRAEMLAELMRLREGVAIAGTHGKTTTTSLTGHLLTAAGLDPTVVVGGRVHLLEAHARMGSGRLLVCEADEFDRSFLELTPVWAVITSIESEHLDCYGTAQDLEDAFVTFGHRVPFYGAILACTDDAGTRALIPRLERRVVTYGLSPQAWLRGEILSADATGTLCAVYCGENRLGEVFVPLVGRHNVQNALAALAVGLELELPFDTLADALKGFSGVARRFELKGERAGVTVVDDYAHHPTEVTAALTAARQAYPGRRVVALFQPHLYSRTRDFADDFAESLLAAEVALVLPIYPARERAIEGVNSSLIVDAARRLGHRQVLAIEEDRPAINAIRDLIRKGDVLLTLGAGSVYTWGDAWLEGATS
ncbi:MAG: UDP-N-acetylmuramate--L-alanine ligase [bacterium]|nr:UDP-N-acetylmuramate--L-alanine ligase [bacterium]